MRFSKCGNWLLALTVALGSSAAFADTVNGGSWTTWDSTNLYGSPSSGTYKAFYWNNFSADGVSNASQNQANIGWTLTNGGTYNNPSLTPLANPPGSIPYLSNGNAVGNLPGKDASGNPLGNQEVPGTDAPGTISLTNTGTGMEAFLRDAVTGIKGGSPGILYFGYYLTNPDGSPDMSSLVRLFSSADAAGATGGLPMNTTYGFFVQNVQGEGTPAQTTFTFFTDAAANTNTGAEPVSPEQHFALFQNNANSLWVGAFGQPDCIVANGDTPENSPCAQGWAFDYNDFVVEIAPAPEPASMALLGGGLVLAGLLLRRRLIVRS